MRIYKMVILVLIIMTTSCFLSSKNDFQSGIYSNVIYNGDEIAFVTGHMEYTDNLDLSKYYISEYILYYINIRTGEYSYLEIPAGYLPGWDIPQYSSILISQTDKNIYYGSNYKYIKSEKRFGGSDEIKYSDIEFCFSPDENEMIYESLSVAYYRNINTGYEKEINNLTNDFYYINWDRDELIFINSNNLFINDFINDMEVVLDLYGDSIYDARVRWFGSKIFLYYYTDSYKVMTVEYDTIWSSTEILNKKYFNMANDSTYYDINILKDNNIEVNIYDVDDNIVKTLEVNWENLWEEFLLLLFEVSEVCTRKVFCWGVDW